MSQDKKLSVCSRCGYEFLDDDDVFIQGVGKFAHEGPLVGVNLQELIALAHLGCVHDDPRA